MGWVTSHQMLGCLVLRLSRRHCPDVSGEGSLVNHRKYLSDFLTGLMLTSMIHPPLQNSRAFSNFPINVEWLPRVLLVTRPFFETAKSSDICGSSSVSVLGMVFSAVSCFCVIG